MARADGKEKMVEMEKDIGMIYWYLKWSHLRRLKEMEKKKAILPNPGNLAGAAAVTAAFTIHPPVPLPEFSSL